MSQIEVMDHTGSGPPTPEEDTPGEADIAHRVAAEQIRILFSWAGTTFVANLLVAAAVVWILDGDRVTLGNLLWFAAVGVVSLSRYLMVQSFRRAEAADGRMEPWRQRYLIGAGLSGLLWTYAVLVMVPEAPLVSQLLVLWILAGLCTGVVLPYAVWLPAYFTYTLPIILPAAGWSLSVGDMEHRVIGALLILFMGFVSLMAVYMNRNSSRALRLRFQKQGLVEVLNQACDRAERHAGELDREMQRTRRAQRDLVESERRFRTLAETMDAAVFVYRDTLLYVNPTGRRWLEYGEDELYRMSPWAILHPQDQPQARERARARLRDGDATPMIYDVRLLSKSGRVMWMHVTTGLARFDGHDAGIGTGVDITERKRAEEALFHEKETAQVTLASIGDGVLTSDAEGRINYLNPAGERITGRRLEEAVNHRLLEILELVEESGEPIDDPMLRCLREGRLMNCGGDHVLLRRADGQEFSIELTVSPIRDRAGQILGTVLVFHDVTELRGLTRLMSYQASHDALTGLVNRREFELRLERALHTARAEGRRHVLLYMDLDQFKVVNDSSGHNAGDELLRQLADHLQVVVRDSDTLARLGGDEFGVLLESCPRNQAVRIAEELRTLVGGYHFTWGERVFSVGISIGLVEIDVDSGTLTDVLSAADSACYLAKEQGRNRVQIYQQDDSALVKRHGQMQWMQRIQQALREDRFRLFFQRIQPLTYRGDRPHVELLLRLLDEEGKLVLPGAFIPAAERYHLMPVLDRWVLKTAFRALADPAFLLGEDGMCSINLSGQSLGDEAFLVDLLDLSEEYAVDFSRICFEITETAAIGNLELALNLMEELKQKGCSFALDDFGSGLSSFRYLKQLPVDYLKIDGSFVRQLLTDAKGRALVESIQQVARVMEMQTIAECVESDEISAALVELGADYGQGFALHRPQPLEDR